MAEEKFPQFAEDDDVARARAFWADNGKSIIFGIVLGVGGIVGFNFWQGYEQTQGERASEQFETVQTADSTESALELAQSLQKDHGKSPYATLAAFSVVKRLVDESKYDDAVTQLKWVVEMTTDEATKHVARIRLSTVLLAQDRAEDVIQLISDIDSASFASRYAELSGDAYAMRGKDGDLEKARLAYENSLATLPESSGYGALIRLKLDNLGAG